MIYVFDLDGTLIDSTFRHGYLMEKLLREEGIEIDEDFSNNYLKKKRDGKNSKIVLREMLNLEETVVDKVVNNWIRDIESDEMLLFDILYSDSIETLERIDKKNVYFLSNRQRKDAVVDELNRLELYRYAEEVYIESPERGIEGKIKRLRDIKSQRLDDILMIGDTEIDYEAANKSGVKSYILDRGFRSRKYWNERMDLRIITYSSLYGVKTI